MYRIFCESYKNYIGMFTDDMKREEYPEHHMES